MALEQMDKQQTLSHEYKPSETVLSQTVIRHDMIPDNSADEGDDITPQSKHRRDITEVFQYDTTTLNKEFQAEITSVFSQFQDDLHAKQSTINSQNEIIGKLNMEMSKYQIKLQEMKKEKSEWQSKTINSVRTMVEQQNTDTIIDQLTESFQLNESSKSIDEISQKIKAKYSTQKKEGVYLLVLGVGIIVGYMFKDNIKSLLNQ